MGIITCFTHLNMSHPSRVRELKRPVTDIGRITLQSHPSRVRELKLIGEQTEGVKAMSHPSRVRELKLRYLMLRRKGSLTVAPLPGA